MPITKLEAVELRTCWAVRPVNQLGTCGWVDGKHWNVVYVSKAKAKTAEQAIKRTEVYDA